MNVAVSPPSFAVELGASGPPGPNGIFVRPEWYGALGDGENDDLAALTTAAGVGPIVYLTPGARYGCSTTYAPPAGAVHMGAGTICALAGFTAPNLINPSSGNRFEGTRFDGANLPIPTSGWLGVGSPVGAIGYIVNANDVTFEDCWILNSPSGGFFSRGVIAGISYTIATGLTMTIAGGGATPTSGGPSAGIAPSSSYDPETGLVTLVFIGPSGLVPGASVTITSATGTGDVAAINGVYTAGADALPNTGNRIRFIRPHLVNAQTCTAQIPSACLEFYGCTDPLVENADINGYTLKGVNMGNCLNARVTRGNAYGPGQSNVNAAWYEDGSVGSVWDSIAHSGVGFYFKTHASLRCTLINANGDGTIYAQAAQDFKCIGGTITIPPNVNEAVILEGIAPIINGENGGPLNGAIVDGLTARRILPATNPFQVGVRLASAPGYPVSGVSVVNCLFENMYYGIHAVGIAGAMADDCLIDNNTFHNTVAYDILSYANALRADRNTFKYDMQVASFDGYIVGSALFVTTMLSGALTGGNIIAGQSGIAPFSVIVQYNGEGGVLDYSVAASLTMTITGGSAVPTAGGAAVTIAAGTYNPATGAVSLTFAGPSAFLAGESVTVSGATGTGSFAAINGVYTAGAGTLPTATGTGGVGVYILDTTQTIGSIGSPVAMNATGNPFPAVLCYSPIGATSPGALVELNENRFVGRSLNSVELGNDPSNTWCTQFNTVTMRGNRSLGGNVWLDMDLSNTAQNNGSGNLVAYLALLDNEIFGLGSATAMELTFHTSNKTRVNIRGNAALEAATNSPATISLANQAQISGGYIQAQDELIVSVTNRPNYVAPYQGTAVPSSGLAFNVGAEFSFTGNPAPGQPAKAVNTVDGHSTWVVTSFFPIPDGVFSALPAASSVASDVAAWVTDANAAFNSSAIGNAAGGSGANRSRVYSDGSIWRYG